jgi:hypothetical protein
LPILANAAMFILFQSNIHRLLDALGAEIDARIESLRENMESRFDGMDVRLRVLEQQR